MHEEHARIALVGLIGVFALAAGAVVGRASAPSRHGATAAIVVVRGVAVGVSDSPAGALAAADNYLASASQSVEQNPTAFTAFVNTVYTPASRASALASAARARASDVADMRNYAHGGRAVAVIAARRLGGYTPGRATVTSWLGGFVWGPDLAPRQSWNLIDTTLIWRHGRWLVRSINTQRTPAPVPSVVFIDGHNNQTSVFDARLAGMTAPFYGAG